MPGEVSFLNNERTFFVDIQKKSLHILYFSRELGNDFKILRSELARDPGTQFTSLLRLSPDRFLLQGQRISGDEALNSGFPTDKEILKLYDCIILGSFPAEDWNEKQQKALLGYVEEGGSVIFLGGEHSFGLGKYASSDLSPLFPWQISDFEEKLLYGNFSVSLSKHKNSLVESMEELILEASHSNLRAINQPGTLRHAAVNLLDASTEKGLISVIALQPYGKGQTLGIATNMLWLWARTSELTRTVYGKFWRQAVRSLNKPSERGQILGFEWDKNSYRPGETASLSIQAKTKEPIVVTAFLTKGKKEESISVQPDSDNNSYIARLFFPEKGEYFFRLVAYQKDKIVETYQKSFFVEPLMPEGSKLEVKENFLNSLALQTGGFFMTESQSSLFWEKMKETFSPSRTLIEISLVKDSPIFFLIFIGILILEWTIRRSMNLL